MHFHYPSHFNFLFGYALAIALTFWSRFRRRRDILKLGDWRLIQHLVPVAALKRRQTKDVLTLIGILFILLAAVGPQFGSKLAEVKHRGVDVFIAIDTSRSMLAEDVPPSRLERAKRSLELLISKLEGNRVGIIAFAQYPVLQCPLTTDTEAARMFLDIIDEKTVPSQGTSIGDAIRLGVNSFNKEDKTGKAIVLLTDGEDHRSDPIAAANLAKDNGVVLLPIGIGTAKGEVIKERDEQGKVIEFHKFKGEMVLSRLDEALLAKIATITGGHYYRASSTDKEIDEIADMLNGFDKKELSSKIFQRFEERYQYAGLLGLLLLLFEFFFAECPGAGKRILQWIQSQQGFMKRVGRSSGLLLMLTFLAGTVQAHWKDQVREGNHLVQKGDYAGARAEFESAQIDAPEAAFLPYNIAGTYYLEGNLEQAQKTYEKAKAAATGPDLKSKIHYNLGHLLFTMGKREEAINEFKECLKLNPKDMDAKYNIEYIKAGKQPPPPPQRPQNQDQKSKDSSDNKSQQEKGKGDSSPSNEKQDERTKNSGEIKKEDAERVLQMMQEQEADKMRKGKPVSIGTKKPKKQNEGEEDW